MSDVSMVTKSPLTDSISLKPTGDIAVEPAPVHLQRQSRVVWAAGFLAAVGMMAMLQTGTTKQVKSPDAVDATNESTCDLCNDHDWVSRLQ
jgi:hypothetical protein